MLKTNSVTIWFKAVRKFHPQPLMGSSRAASASWLPPLVIKEEGDLADVPCANLGFCPLDIP